GLHFLQNGHLAVALYGAKNIQVYDDQGKLTSAFRASGEDLWPRDITVLQNNIILVADSHTQKIRPFKMDAYTSKKDFADLHARHLFKEPTSVAVCHRKKHIVVSDTGNNDITILNTNGQLQHRFGCHGNGDVEFDNPEFISVDPFTDRIIVSDCNNHCVKIYDFEGRFVCRIGEHGQQVGQLSHPGGVVADDQGNIIVADGANNRVCV
ncbi:hypothetical protein CAPTEDRAFT_46566, partial [Capitella teleta]|uniref:Uncharacterized protein n=1 Tax=Capitella teleta TaxID=283909 RepID=X2B4K6_CAPTE